MVKLGELAQYALTVQGTLQTFLLPPLLSTFQECSSGQAVLPGLLRLAAVLTWQALTMQGSSQICS